MKFPLSICFMLVVTRSLIRWCVCQSGWRLVPERAVGDGVADLMLLKASAVFSRGSARAGWQLG
ncbi:hypothetical protein EHW99_0992 [Erwinia amylovora]|uniref:Uncharacterized protein n=1 Tax=Erwinia amylovora NBRC 12687 = CFBP 1232 TaxID=1219359 RepID=A0A830ZUU9_ERWAM|nr:hypothetical protein [Erwinia amylovora]CCO94612.1 hypothetical protein BN437_2702 [Erwinia amylovora NBRC 12687 = CFBP 1232]QJQ53699.1 hypothetical protein EHX00_0992 [Erwinia amylovora]QJQ57397.1 hypothetical protein EHW99_0992 [Erwinia amylovora]QJQ61096.1 hypothetical protein EHW98_0992 [Erwinia amylovora]QJQ64898.1 hypothetical protein EHW96_0992 [Erwinia amylovora]